MRALIETVLGDMRCADKYVGMLVMDAKQLTDMELLVLVRQALGSTANSSFDVRCVALSMPENFC